MAAPAPLGGKELTRRLLEGARRRDAAQFGHVHDERHWSQKRREEMTARDWRIFRVREPHRG